jgi:hypothetical protein
LVVTAIEDIVGMALTVTATAWLKEEAPSLALIVKVAVP